jgi:glycine cleavage system transcriptional repressor
MKTGSWRSTYGFVVLNSSFVHSSLLFEEVLVPQLIINAIGPDRPGIVEQVTGHLHARGANVLDSRMVNLRGQFAMLMLFEADDAAAAALRESLPQLADSMALKLMLLEPVPAARSVQGIPYKLRTYSMDQPGIVHGVSEILLNHGVNIEDLTTRQESAPFMGAAIFLMEMRVTVPLNVPIREVRSRLQTLCDTLNCDVDFEPEGP